MLGDFVQWLEKVKTGVEENAIGVLRYVYTETGSLTLEAIDTPNEINDIDQIGQISKVHKNHS